ncbi:hypothetical protein JKP88DRAFT_250116 [Tribonema minus]|uniref:Uncharacterized protein n=1 Tax=Tribonema minus TaxID=303371 RepID=A0A835YKT3_9STRA|nr:hypothetical protein JKP88DRAFT_250116 [Tribonema minus]
MRAAAAPAASSQRLGALCCAAAQHYCYDLLARAARAVSAARLSVGGACMQRCTRCSAKLSTVPTHALRQQRWQRPRVLALWMLGSMAGGGAGARGSSWRRHVCALSPAPQLAALARGAAYVLVSAACQLATPVRALHVLQRVA